MFVYPFPTNQKYWKIRVSSSPLLILNFAFENKNVRIKCQNIYSNCPKKALKSNGIQPPPPPGLNQFWGSACPRMHIHEYIISPVSRFLKKNGPTDPPDFQAKRGKQTFYFLDLSSVSNETGLPVSKTGNSSVGQVTCPVDSLKSIHIEYI